ncbi:phage terminase large subunit [Erythrobacter sp.]|uniref:phage terminase large subunit n=1 Tax=Erythrobacter sp. TaxID=1042 RepID=UPI003C7661B8
MSTTLRSPDNPRLLLRNLLRHDLVLFAKKAWPGVEWNWHHDAMVHALAGVLEGTTKRLIVNLHPRSGKSNLGNVIFPAFVLGKKPETNIIGVSYSNELSGKHGRDCRAILESSWYREVFPRTLLSRSRSAAHDFETTRGGGRLSTSVGGSLTGRGGSIIIMDDVIKPEDANSELARDHLNDWFGSTLSSRLDDKRSGAIILLMQRLHQYDLTGMLIEMGGWEVLSLPVIADTIERVVLPRGKVHTRRAGDLLHVEREPREVLDRIRTEMGSRAFSAQYLQSPLPAEGNLFKAAWLRRYEPSDLTQEGTAVQSWDTGIKTGERNSYSVCITAKKSGNTVHLLDVWRGRLEFPDLERKLEQLARLHGATVLLIEDKASGQELIQNLRSREPRGVPSPIARRPSTEKKERAAGISPMVEAGQVLIPSEAAWLGDFLSEVLAFPSGRFDDQVDAFTQLLDWVRERQSEPVALNAGPIEMIESDDDSDIGRYEETFDPWAV